MRSLILLGIALALTVGCQRERPAVALTSGQRDAIQNRVTNHFPHVVLFKAAEGGFESDFAVQLAPILLQALAESDPDGREPNALSVTTVFFATNQVRIHGKDYPQFSYFWHHNTRQSGETLMQGVRITLDSRGAPALWEILRDSTGANVLYAGRSIEVLAQAEFGLPLPGRRFALERDDASAAFTVVANVIEDGPVPMGPIVYLDPEARDAMALVCRCMPAQFSQLQWQKDYRLEQKTDGLPEFNSTPLEQRLRLPTAF